MTEPKVRFAVLERGQIDLETGEFPMILATDGEASDGDILSIEGAVFGGRAPLQISHVNDPRSTAGTISGFRRDLTATPKRLKARGKIELEGEGPAAEIRRDLAFMVSRGHVNGISVRWEPIKYQARTALGKDHPAFVGDGEKDWRKRNGMFHEKWRVLEGSIVAVQADREAMIGRAEQTEGVVAEFWRAMAKDAEQTEERAEEPEPELEASDTATSDEPEPGPTPDPEQSLPAPEPEAPTEEARLAAFAAQVREFAALGVPLERLAETVEAERKPAEPTLADLMAEISTLRTQIAALEAGRVNGAPTPPIRTVQDIFNQYEQRLRKTNSEILAGVRASVDARRGKVNPSQSARQQMHAELEGVLRSWKAEESEASPRLKAIEDKLESLVVIVRERLKSAPDKDIKP